MKKQKGFGLVETLIAVSIIGAVSVTAINYKVEEMKEVKINNFTSEVASIIKAVDSRILIDGYHPSRWGTLIWSNKDEIAKDLIAKQLVSTKDPSCSGGSWIPEVPSEEKTSIIDCYLWEHKLPVDVKMDAKLNLDNVGFIQGFDLYFTFNSQEEFQDNFINLRKAITREKAYNHRELSGMHSFEFVQDSNRATKLSVHKCINNPTDCAVKASYSRSGGNEYIRADGTNSMIANHLTFIESISDTTPLTCQKWVNTKTDNTGIWTLKPNEDCGIGIYDATAVAVDIASNSGTFTNVVLDKECVVYGWNGTSVVDTGKKSPCGMTQNGGSKEVVQVVEKSMATNSYFANQYSKTSNIDVANVQVANIDDIRTKKINTAVLDVTDKLNVELLNVNGVATFNNKVNFNHLTSFNQKSTFNNDVNFKRYATFDKSVTFKEALNARNITAHYLGVAGTIATHELKMSGNATANGYMKAPNGHFDNINNQMSSMNTKIVNLQNELANERLKASQMASCISSNNTLLSTRSASCPSGYTGTAYLNTYRKSLWNGSTCQQSTYATKNTSSCKERVSGGCGANGCGNGGHGAGGNQGGGGGGG